MGEMNRQEEMKKRLHELTEGVKKVQSEEYEEDSKVEEIGGRLQDIIKRHTVFLKPT
jgi:hypothetical protein